MVYRWIGVAVLVAGFAWLGARWTSAQLGWWNDPVPIEQMPADLPGQRTTSSVDCGSSDNTDCLTTVEYLIKDDDRCEVAGELAVFFISEGAADSAVSQLRDSCTLGQFRWEDGAVTWTVTSTEDPSSDQIWVAVGADMGPGR